MPTAPPGRNSRVLPHSDPPALGMEQPAAPQSPTGASSRLFHLPTPPGGCAQRGPPAGEDGSTHLPPGLSRNFSPTPLASTARSAVFPPPAAPRMEASAQRPRRVHFGKWGGWARNGRLAPTFALPYLCSPPSFSFFSRGPPSLPPPPSPAPLPRSSAASDQEAPRCDTGGRRYGNPARPRPSPPLPGRRRPLRAEPEPPPPFCARNEARSCSAPAALPAPSAAVLGSSAKPPWKQRGRGGRVVNWGGPRLGYVGVLGWERWWGYGVWLRGQARTCSASTAALVWHWA